jgi:hypothetical protein
LSSFPDVLIALSGDSQITCPNDHFIHF